MSPSGLNRPPTHRVRTKPDGTSGSTVRDASALRTEGTALRVLPHPVIDQHKRGHRLDDRNGARDDTRIMTTAADQFRCGAVYVHCLLRPKNCGCRFESHAKHDLLAIADATLRASAAIGRGANAAIARFESIV